VIEINARQIGGLIVVVGDYIKDLQEKYHTVGLTVLEDAKLHRAHKLMKEINDLQPKRIENE
jgi:hypothetical protein